MWFLINAQAWLLIITTVAGILTALIGSVVVMRLILHNKKKDLVDWIIFAVLLMACITLVLTIVVSLIESKVASAAENSASAEPPTTVEKQVASCPTEFNPDDSAWALHRVEEPTLQKIAEGLAVVERIRIFTYIPDPEQRIWVHIKKLVNPDCAAALYSYSSMDDFHEKRILGVIKAPGKNTAFLLTEKGWESGNDWETFATNCSRTGCDLTFVLYRNKEPFATRTMFINQYHLFPFQEPVE